jgi:hypothetical protein
MKWASLHLGIPPPLSIHTSRKYCPSYQSGWGGGDVFIQSCYIFMVFSMSFVQGDTGILLVKIWQQRIRLYQN